MPTIFCWDKHSLTLSMTDHFFSSLISSIMRHRLLKSSEHNTLWIDKITSRNVCICCHCITVYELLNIYTVLLKLSETSRELYNFDFSTTPYNLRNSYCTFDFIVLYKFKEIFCVFIDVARLNFNKFIMKLIIILNDARKFWCIRMWIYFRKI